MAVRRSKLVLFWVLFLSALGLLSAYTIYGANVPQVDQVARWDSAEVRKIDILRADKLVARYQRTASRYSKIQPLIAPVLFSLHYRESDNDFTAHPHNGDPLTHRTFHVPRGRLPGMPPPYTFEQSALDAWFVCDRLDLADWQSIQAALNRIESFNGMGYRSRNVCTPYLWAGTSIYLRGKYTSDGRFDPYAQDRQLGVAAILKRMAARKIDNLHLTWLTPQVPEPTQPPTATPARSNL